MSERFFGRLLVATDGLDNGNRAVSYAVALARRHHSEFIVCYVVDHAVALTESSISSGDAPMFVPLMQSLDEAAASILSEAVRRAEAVGLSATSVTLEGRTVQAIVGYATERHADAIVMGTRGKSGLNRLFLGSTADGILRSIDLPAFVVPPDANIADPAFDRILVAVDDSDPSDAAVTFALRLAEADGTRLIFCGVVETNNELVHAGSYGYDPTPVLEEIRIATAESVTRQAERAREAGISFERLVVEGDAVQQILAAAKSQRVGLIVVGTHGRRGLRRFLVGSVAETLVRRSTLPVVVVRRATERAGATTNAVVPSPEVETAHSFSR